MINKKQSALEMLDDIYCINPNVIGWQDIKGMNEEGELAIEIVSQMRKSGDSCMLVELDEQINFIDFSTRLVNASVLEAKDLIADYERSYENACIQYVDSSDFIQEKIAQYLEDIDSLNEEENYKQVSNY